MRQPYGEWLDQNLVHLKDLSIPNHRVQTYTQEERDRLYKAFGYTYEEVKNSILAMAETGEEPAAAMGTDILWRCSPNNINPCSTTLNRCLPR